MSKEIEVIAIETLEQLNKLSEKKLNKKICSSLHKINETNLCIPGTTTSFNKNLNNNEGICDSCLATFFLEDFCK